MLANIMNVASQTLKYEYLSSSNAEENVAIYLESFSNELTKEIKHMMLQTALHLRGGQCGCSSKSCCKTCSQNSCSGSCNSCSSSAVCKPCCKPHCSHAPNCDRDRHSPDEPSSTNLPWRQYTHHVLHRKRPADSRSPPCDASEGAVDTRTGCRSRKRQARESDNGS